VEDATIEQQTSRQAGAPNSKVISKSDMWSTVHWYAVDGV